MAELAAAEQKQAGSATIAVTAGPDDAGKRLDSLLAAHSAGFSRNRTKSLIKDGHASIGGATILDPNHRVNPGEEITLEVPEPEDPTPRGEAIPLRVVYEDDALIVVDKPAGMVVHPAAGNWTGTLVNALIAHCGASLSGIGGVRRPGIVHRLDKDTTGLIVVAKTDAAHRGLAEQFADHGREGPLQRRYRALVWGAPETAAGTVNAPLDRSNANRMKRTVVTSGGKHAVTHWQVLQRYAVDGAREPVAALVECRLETGRTHQIRVHMAHIGHPLVGDADYAAGFATKARRLPDGASAAVEALGRQALHAAVLGFRHPLTGETLIFESSPPADMATVLEEFTKLSI